MPPHTLLGWTRRYVSTGGTVVSSGTNLRSPRAAAAWSAAALLPAGDALQHVLGQAQTMLDFLVWLPTSPYAWPVALGLFVAVLGVSVGIMGRRRQVQNEAERLQAWFDHSTTPCLWLDDDFGLNRSNAAAAELVSVTRRSRRRAFRHLLEAEGIDLDELLDELAEEAVVRRNLHVEHQDGVRRYSVEFQRMEAAGESFVVAAARDMTDYDKSHRLLRQFNRQVLDALPVRIVVMAPSGEYLYANRGFAPGRKAQDWIRGKTDFEYCSELGLHPEIALRRRSQRKLAVNTGEQVAFEECLRMPDGTERHFERVFAPIFDLDGEVTAVVGCGVDVTERKLIQGHAQELEDERDRFERFRNALLDNVNHELRTPLTGIIGSAQILEQEVDEEVVEFAGAIVQNGKRLMQTLDALVELAAMESSGGLGKPRVVSLDAVLDQVVEELTPMAEEKGLFLRCSEVARETLLRADPLSLGRVLHSLVGNAVKFTETGGVLVDVEADGRAIRVRVMDTGVGIDNGFLPYLFDAFHQESSGTDRAFEGIGLGLSVVKRHLDAMGATVKVDSEKGEGSMFTISFPHRFPNPLADSVQKPRVLMLGDDADVRRSVDHLVSPFVRFDVADNVREAGAKSAHRPYDAVLMPVEADPERSAEEVLRELQRHEGFAATPIVVLDPHGLPNGREQLLSAGFAEYVDRPFERLALLEALCSLLMDDREDRRAA